MATGPQCGASARHIDMIEMLECRCSGSPHASCSAYRTRSSATYLTRECSWSPALPPLLVQVDRDAYSGLSASSPALTWGVRELLRVQKVEDRQLSSI